MSLSAVRSVKNLLYIISQSTICQSSSVMPKSGPSLLIKRGYNCWNCNATLSTEAITLKCDSCSVPQPLSKKNVNRFRLFNIDDSYNVNLKSLQNEFHRLQNLLHPDKYVGESETIQDIVSDVSSYINSSYQILSDPYERAKYLLILKTGQQIDDESIQSTESGQQKDMKFLSWMMDLRENIDCLDSLEQSQKDKLYKELVEANDNIVQDLLANFASDDLDAAKSNLGKLRYLLNALNLFKQKL